MARGTGQVLQRKIQRDDLRPLQMAPLQEAAELSSDQRTPVRELPEARERPPERIRGNQSMEFT